MAITPGKAFTSGTMPGFSYQQLPNWAEYPCSTCTPNPTENWNSAEADNIALEALQTVLSSTQAGSPPPAPTRPLSGTPLATPTIFNGVPSPACLGSCPALSPTSAAATAPSQMPSPAQTIPSHTIGTSP